MWSRLHGNRGETFVSRQSLHIFGNSTLIDDQQIGLEILAEDFVLAAQGFVVQEVADHVEDGVIQDQEARFDRLIAESLDQERLAHARWSQQKYVAAFADEAATHQIK